MSLKNFRLTELTELTTDDNIEIMKARQLFPCRDELATKSIFDISIMHHRKYTALSNMPIRLKQRKINDMRKTHFEQSFIISAQHLAVIVTTFAVYEHVIYSNINIYYKRHTWNHLTYAKFIINNVVPHFINKYFQKLSKLDIVWYQGKNFATFGLLLQR